jgi:hypothetical protein
MAQLVRGHMRYLDKDEDTCLVQPIMAPPPTVVTRSAAAKLRQVTQLSNDITLFSDMLEHGQYEPAEQAQLVHCLKVRLDKANTLLWRE